TILKRAVFETAALMHNGEIPTLLRVARRVLIWIEPLLYRVLRVSNLKASRVHALLKAIESKPADFFHKCVHHLSLEYITMANALRILGVCTGVLDLALAGHLASPDILPVLAPMPLQRVSTYLGVLFGGANNLAHPTFTCVTHLNAMDLDDDGETGILAPLPALPALTHLALGRVVRPHAVQAFLQKRPHLELALSLWLPSEQDDFESAQVPHVLDVRFVTACCPRDYWANWEASAKGLPNLWSLGDDFVARKRRGEIEGTILALPVSLLS
ncbi:hypothetical protein DFH06DRAFT_1018613, partial [Mycena polygramma]